ncbi:MAG: fumarate hydratase [Firmicutes bacterium]|nr:fumarate hydratase [Bacillota bacterium]
MRKITAHEISCAVAKSCIEANYKLSDDIVQAIKTSLDSETNERAKDVLERLLENLDMAQKEKMAICQDTGMAVIFVRLGQNVFVEGDIETAINEGVKTGYKKGCLRNSVVSDPLRRVNTGDNTPAVIHYEITKGEKIEITVAPKGFGSENMSAVKMLKPSDGEQGVVDFIVETVEKAASNPCPPIVVGVGIGGTMEKAAVLSKKALLVPINYENPDAYYARLEGEIKNRLNGLGIGPMGWGGDTTALGVNILTYPTHIAGLPVAVNISCHVTRHFSVII